MMLRTCETLGELVGKWKRKAPKRVQNPRPRCDDCGSEGVDHKCRLTPLHIQALRVFAAIHGAKWKRMFFHADARLSILEYEAREIMGPAGTYRIRSGHYLGDAAVSGGSRK